MAEHIECGIQIDRSSFQYEEGGFESYVIWFCLKKVVERKGTESDFVSFESKIEVPVSNIPILGDARVFARKKSSENVLVVVLVRVRVRGLQESLLGREKMEIETVLYGLKLEAERTN